MFRIGEFSKLTQVTIRMLRYYDEAGLLKPARIDGLTGYRMYSADQIPTLNKIIYLRDSGFNVSEIASALSHDDGFIIEQLDNKYSEIEDNIRAEQEKLRRISLARNELLQGKNDMHYNVSIKPVPACLVLSLRRRIPDYYAEGALWQEMSAFARERHLSVSDKTFSIYHDEEYKETDVDVELCAPVQSQGRSCGDFIYRQVEAVPKMACTMVYGDFSNIAGAYLAFAAWLQENSGYQMAGSSRQIVHRGPWNETEPENYLTEIQIPLNA